MANLYKTYQLYQVLNGQEPIPMYPPQYSIDAEGTQVEQIKYENYCGCGDVNQMLVFWQTVPNEYICKDCGEDAEMERWVVTDPSAVNDYICEECPSAKLYATYSDSSTYFIECNDAVNLTRNEVRGNQDAAYSAMTSAQIGNCVTIIGAQAFYGCSSLARVYMPTSINTIGQSAFSNCSSLSSVTIPNSVSSVGDGAFYNCQGLNGAQLSTSMTEIPESMFEQCTGMTNIVIPSNITTINNWSFSGCRRLTITMEATTPPTLALGTSSAYNHFTSVLSIRVPAASVATYSTATGWSNYSQLISGY